MSNENKNIYHTAPELQAVERLGQQQCLAWNADKSGETLPQELSKELVSAATNGQQVMLNVTYRHDNQSYGMLFGSTTGSEGDRSLTFIDYAIDDNNQPEIKRYADSKSLQLQALQTDQLTQRFLTWPSKMGVGEQTKPPSTSTDFESENMDIIVESISAVVDEPSPDANASVHEEYTFMKLQKAIAEQMSTPDLEHLTSEDIAKRSLFQKLFHRR